MKRDAASREVRRHATMERGQYRFENMPKVEKLAYVAKYGLRPTLPDRKTVTPLEYYRAVIKQKQWAAQLPDQRPYIHHSTLDTLAALEKEAAEKAAATREDRKRRKL